MIKLLKESGHLDDSAQMTEQALRQYIEAHPEIIDLWAGFSEDERASEFGISLDQSIRKHMDHGLSGSIPADRARATRTVPKLALLISNDMLMTLLSTSNMQANNAAHSDARATVVLCEGRVARAGGCER